MLIDIYHVSNTILIRFNKEITSGKAPVMSITQFGGINLKKLMVIYCLSPKPIHPLHQLD